MRDLVPFVQFKKREKHSWGSVTLLKVRLLHERFSRFLNCINGTKSCKTSKLIDINGSKTIDAEENCPPPPPHTHNPSPDTNANPNPIPNRRAMFLGGNCPDTDINTYRSM